MNLNELKANKLLPKSLIKNDELLKLKTELMEKIELTIPDCELVLSTITKSFKAGQDDIFNKIEKLKVLQDRHKEIVKDIFAEIEKMDIVIPEDIPLKASDIIHIPAVIKASIDKLKSKINEV